MSNPLSEEVALKFMDWVIEDDFWYHKIDGNLYAEPCLPDYAVNFDDAYDVIHKLTSQYYQVQINCFKDGVSVLVYKDDITVLVQVEGKLIAETICMAALAIVELEGD